MTGCVPPGCAPSTPPNCVEQIGCQPVIPCNYTPPTSCYPIPGGGTIPVCFIVCDQPPDNTTPVLLTIYRNVYVPINITNGGTPHVVPVNLQVKYREIHYLSDANGNPIDQTGNILSQTPPDLIPKPSAGTTGPAGAMPSLQRGASATPPPASPVASAPPNNKPAATPTPTASAQPQPPVPTPSIPSTVQANTPAKKWYLIQNEGVYGYGYLGPDGLLVVDEGSRRSTPPDAAQPPPAPVTTASSN